VALEKSEALVLRVIPFRDTSRILTVYTAEHGLVSLLAKGVRGPKPRFGAALELFSVIDLVYYHKESRELQLLSQAMLLESHLGLGGHPLRFAYGMAVLEFLLKALSAPEPPGRIYPLSLRTLEVLETSSLPALPALFRMFELKAISFLGHRPEFYQCVECGETVGERTGEGFSPRMGGVVCAGCRERVPDALGFEPPVLALLKDLLTGTLAAIAESPPPPVLTAAAARILEAFLQVHLERYESLRAVRLAGTLTPERETAPS
jgi:DNA repair protein RecO (recombination protein O)